MKVKEFEEKLIALLNELAEEKNMMLIGEYAKELIKKRTRLGYGVEKTGDERKKLKALSDSYIDQRKGKVSFIKTKAKNIIPVKPLSSPKLSPSTSPTKSNLTKSGSMLDSMSVTSSNGKVRIAPQGSRSDSRFSNEEIASLVTKQGRPFNNLAKGDLKQLRDFVSSLLNTLSRKL